MLKGYSVGAEVTLVSKGIQRSEYSENIWIDERQKGRTSFFHIERIGTVYLYGKYVRFEEGKKELCYYESKINPADYKIFYGIRQDLKQKHTDFIDSLNRYEKARQDRRRELERKAHHLTNKLMKIWETENPRPKGEEMK